MLSKSPDTKEGYSSLQANSNVKFAAWPTSWRPAGADRFSPRGPKANCMNIVLGISVRIKASLNRAKCQEP